jgi:hypothetical protein
MILESCATKIAQNMNATLEPFERFFPTTIEPRDAIAIQLRFEVYRDAKITMAYVQILSDTFEERLERTVAQYLQLKTDVHHGG